MDRKELSEIILVNLRNNKIQLQDQYNNSKGKIGYFYLDNLLPNEVALAINNCFPDVTKMVLKKSIRENKYIGVQMNQYHPLLEDIIYAFQDERIVNVISEICGLTKIYPDDKLYAGGISLMQKDQFLNPHLDNSHDKDRERWRVLNLLYYVTPNWNIDNGGNLELWPNGLNNKQVTIESKFNRLAVMATHNESLHSVSPILVDSERKCISNYYFSDTPLLATDTFHVTSFRGRPENKITDFILQTDTWLRMNIRKLFKKGIKENPHYYDKNNPS